MTEACIDPTRSAFEAFKALPRDEPLAMLNLVRFRDRAEYEAGHALAGAGLTGAEAYANYGRDSAPVFSKVGGSIAWRASRTHCRKNSSRCRALWARPLSLKPHLRTNVGVAALLAWSHSCLSSPCAA